MLVVDSPRPTPRQLDVLALAALGYTREEIGRELFISPWTVKVDLDQLRARISARNVAHALSICLMLGLLQVDARARAVRVVPKAASEQNEIAHFAAA